MTVYLTYKLINVAFVEIETIQKLTRRALDMTWRNSLSHDWISEDNAKTFPLMEYYTDLRWTRTVKRALQNVQENLSSIFDILSLPQAGDEPTNVLVEGNFRRSNIFSLKIHYCGHITLCSRILK